MKLISKISGVMILACAFNASASENFPRPSPTPPHICPMYECAPPRPGCHFAPGGAQLDKYGCHTGCGEIVCEQPPIKPPVCKQPVILDSTVQFDLTPNESIPAVANVKLSRAQGCGTIPASGSGIRASCPTTVTLTFTAQTSGLCEGFSARVDKSKSSANILTIIKSRMPNCTRPEHPEKDESQTLQLGQDLPEGSILLGNPLSVTTYFRM